MCDIGEGSSIKEMKIPTHMSWKYLEVWLVLSHFPTGEVNNMRSTGLFILKDDASKLPKSYLTSSISTSKLKENNILLEVVSFDE